MQNCSLDCISLPGQGLNSGSEVDYSGQLRLPLSLCSIRPSLHESPGLRPQEDHFFPQTFPSLTQSPGPSPWTWDSSWQLDQATCLPLAHGRTLPGLAFTSKIK